MHPGGAGQAVSRAIIKIDRYRTSRDYEWLVNTMKKTSLVCIVDYSEDCRDVARTIYSCDPFPYFRIGARGIGYLEDDNEQGFIAQCRKYNVEILIPNKP